jgi:ankyrin repeat protein
MRDIDEQLHRAVELKRPDEVRFLLGRGADVNSVGRAYGPMLVSAARKSGEGDLVCRMLIKAGADILAEEDGMSALCYLVRFNHLELVRDLVARGATVHPSARDFAPLAQISSDDHLEVAKLLIENGADPNACGRYVPSLLSHVAWYGATRVCKYLLDSGRVDVRDHPEALLKAVELGHVETCRLLVRYGMSPSMVPEDPADEYLTPFQAAVKVGRANVVQYFLDECDEDPAQRTLAGITMPKLTTDKGVRTVLRASKVDRAVRAAVADSLQQVADHDAGGSAPSAAAKAYPLAL